MSRKPLRRKQRNNLHTNLSLEPLEDRCLLAVGTFTRVDGDVEAYAGAQTYTLYDDSGQLQLDEGEEPETFAHAKAIAQLSGDGFFLFSESEAHALAVPPIDGALAAPFVSTSVVQKRFASASATAGGYGVARGGDRALSESSVDYEGDPEFSEDLELHGHLYLAVSGGIAALTGDATYVGAEYAVAQIGGASISASYSESLEMWYYQGSVPGYGNLSGYSDGVNLHLKFVLPFTTSGNTSLRAEMNHLTGEPEVTVFNDSAAAFLATYAAAAWVYVTGEGSDDQPGDFNHDGAVDFDDFDLWESGDPRADADNGGVYDAIIDNYDLGVWANNAQDFGIYMVSTTSDDSDGDDYSFGHLSLREALELSDPGDTVIFSPTLFDSGGATITLTDQLSIDNDITIEGPGSDLLTISGNDESRVFVVSSGNAVNISGVTITEGQASGTSDGGAIHNSGDLTLDSVVLTQNEAGRNGGAVYSTGTLNIENSTFYDNVTGSSGGAIAVQGNSANELVVNSSTFSNNQAADGGAIRMHGSNGAGTATIVNSTFSANKAEQHAGAIRLTSNAPALTVVNSTITLNEADIDTTDGVSGVGGGIHVGGGSVTLFNTIVSDNTAATTAGNDIHGSLTSTSDYNLLGTGEQTFQPGTHNVWTNNPGLAPLGDYGGKTKTHVIISGSAAINAGSDSVTSTYELDYEQRGLTRVLGSHVDIGATESGNATTLIITIPDDENDGNYAADDLSLREAIALIDDIPGAVTIMFAEDMFTNGPVTITLSQVPGFATLFINYSVSIVGPGADLLIIDGNADANHKYSVFEIYNYTVSISGLTITGGYSWRDGGGITSNGLLTLSDVRITGNVGDRGGGVYQGDAGLTIIRSEIDNNSADTGGGIYFSSIDAGLLIDSSTVHHNSATTAGGIEAVGDILIRNSTISSNTAITTGGLRLSSFESEDDAAFLVNVTIAENTATSGNVAGLSAVTGVPVTLYNTIVAKNVVGSLEKDVYGTFNSDSGYNFIGAINGSTGLNASTTISGTTSNPEDPMLNALNDYGGPTPTHRLSVDSEALHAGSNDIVDDFDLDFDQRGFPRISFGTVDIGAVELAIEDIFG